MKLNGIFIKKNLIGQKFGRLTILELLRKENGKNIWLCKCDCGNIVEKIGKNILGGHTKSCGCLNIDLIKEIKKSHNMANTRFYKIYHGMKARCYNKNNSRYNYYGERGIKISQSWLESFENFKNDMYESYLEHTKIYGELNTSIDRIDVNGNYELSNCRWATNKQQANNKDYKNNPYFKAISPEGKEFVSNNQMEFARKHDLSRYCIQKILANKFNNHKGWTFRYLTDEEIIEYKNNSIAIF